MGKSLSLLGIRIRTSLDIRTASQRPYSMQGAPRAKPASEAEDAMREMRDGGGDGFYGL